MNRNRYDPWDRKLQRWLNSIDWEMAILYFTLYTFGFISGALAVMIHHQHFITAVLEGL